MRIISQDGMVDIPYESACVYRNAKYPKSIRVQAIGEDECMTFAVYSTPEKAEKAMEELKYAYLSHKHLKFDKKVPKNVSPNIFEGVFGVFQFPKDEELE